MKIVGGLELIQARYDALLVDAWGVIHDGAQCYPGAIQCLEHLARLGKPVVVLSNAARRHEGIQRELERVGVPDDLYQGVVSSGELAWQAMDSGAFVLGRKGYYLGPERSRGLCDDLEIQWLQRPETADFVLNTGAPMGNPHDPGYLTPLLEIIVENQLPMICANPDQVAVRVGELGISAGAIAALYLKLGGRRVIYFGKPHAEIFEVAVRKLSGMIKSESGKSKSGKSESGNSRVLMVGDAFATDIKGAANFGIDSLLIAGGIHQADLTPLGAETIERCSRKYNVIPDYVCQSFDWSE